MNGVGLGLIMHCVVDVVVDVLGLGAFGEFSVLSMSS
jgi:hypothetical protein